MKRIAFVTLAWASALAGGLVPHPAVAQAPAALPPAPAPAPVFDAAAKRAAVTEAARLVAYEYVFPDVGTQAAAMLTQNLDAGKYDAAATPGAFASALTKDLQSFTHDKHFLVLADGVPPDDLPPGPPPPFGLYGFAQVDRLKGNVGYIVLNGFVGKPDFKKGADRAMALIASTDALIIDLRNNGGGAAPSVAYLDSFFFDGKTPIDTDDILWRKFGTNDAGREVFMTEPTPVSYLGKPVYVIAGHGTFSGGEAFAYELQARKRATVVGETTGGGAHPVKFHPIGPGLSMVIPIGQSENPITHSNWEGKGVQPDIAATPDQSFAAAYTAALNAVGHPVTASAGTAEAVTEAHLLVPPRTTPAPGSEDALRRLIAGLADGHPPYDILNDDMANLTRQQLPDLQASMDHLGALQSLTFVEVDLMGNDIYEGKFANGSQRFTVGLGPDGKIVFCGLQPG